MSGRKPTSPRPRRGRARPDLGRRGRLVAHDLPVRRRPHRELERRLEVGLLEHREDAPGVRHLELRVQIHLAVDRVDEAVQALAGVRVPGVGDDDELVLGREIVQLDAHAVADLARVERLAVERYRVHRLRDRVDERRRGLDRREPDGRRAREGLSARRQVEVDLVAVDVDERLALLGLCSGEVLAGHCASLSVRRGSRPRRSSLGGARPSPVVCRDAQASCSSGSGAFRTTVSAPAIAASSSARSRASASLTHASPMPMAAVCTIAKHARSARLAGCGRLR